MAFHHQPCYMLTLWFEVAMEHYFLQDQKKLHIIYIIYIHIYIYIYIYYVLYIIYVLHIHFELRFFDFHIESWLA